MDPRIQNNAVTDLPEGYLTIFLARVTVRNTPCFCAVYTPAFCLSDGILDHAAKIALFLELDGRAIQINDVLFGEKHPFGGGCAYTLIEHNRARVQWTTPDECGKCEFFGTHIHPDDVLVAL